MTTSPLDHWIAHPHGRLFAREWRPLDADDGRPPLVMLHDSLGCVDLWRDLPQALCASTSRRVIAYDRLGFGRSDARTGKLPPDFVAEEGVAFLSAVRRQLGIDDFALLGHSVGGGMAVHAAAGSAGACERLITISAQAFVEERTLEGIRVAKQQFMDPAQVQRLARYHGDKTRWVLDAWIDTWLDPQFAGWSLEEALPRVTCPTLVIHGELDEYGSTRHPELIGQLAGGPVRIEVLRGLGHVPHRESPEPVRTLLSEFLDAAS